VASASLRARAFESLHSANEELKRLRDRLERENVYLRKEVKHHGGDLVMGGSPPIMRALELASQVASTNATVLLVGETGTGKERFASFIHEASPRRSHHMVRVNCSAIPSALIESELFGRERIARPQADDAGSTHGEARHPPPRGPVVGDSRVISCLNIREGYQWQPFH
jgi:transcriptional regulator with PAS, ATPase and Fis domain